MTWHANLSRQLSRNYNIYFMLKNLMNIMTKSMFKGDISCLGNSVLCIDIYEKIFWNENHDLLYELKVSNSHDVTLKTKISTVNAPVQFSWDHAENFSSSAITEASSHSEISLDKMLVCSCSSCYEIQLYKYQAQSQHYLFRRSISKLMEQTRSWKEYQNT